MRHLSATLFVFVLVAALAGASGCLTTIEDGCQSAAETHCASCFECADEVDDDIRGDDLCGLPDGEGEDLEACESFLADRCQTEAATREDPYDALEECETAVEEETCGDLVDREAQDQPAAPAECGRYL